MSIGEILNQSEEEKASSSRPINNISPINFDIFLDESKIEEDDQNSDSNRRKYHRH